MRITKRQLRRLIREAYGDRGTDLHAPGEEPLDWSNRSGGYDDPGYWADDDDVSGTPEVKAMLQAAGFNPDGSFGMDGYPGPGDWQLYSPKDMEGAERWIDAAIAMNDALRQAETALDRGEYQYAIDAWNNIVYPVQTEYSDTGAADTEGREVAGDWLEKAGYEWDG